MNPSCGNARIFTLTCMYLLAGMFHTIGGANSNLTEVDLHEILFHRYKPNIMPKTEASLPISVNIEMYLLSVENIDEKRQTMSIRAFLEITWKDAFLHWTPQDYNNVTIINVKVDSIWTPDVALENTFDRPTDLGQDGGNANIDNEGNVIMWPYKTFTVVCKIYIGNFPFDEQTCIYRFLSWTNPSSVLMLENLSGNIQFRSFAESGEWALTETKVVRSQKAYGLDSWDTLTFRVHLKRKPLYHVMNLMLPVLCISLLNVACFLLPSDGGERVTLSISIFLTLAVFLTIVNSSMPESSDEVAKFGVYVGLQLLGSALTIILTTLSLYLFHREEYKPVNNCFRVLVKMSLITLPEGAHPEVNHVANVVQNGHSDVTGQLANQPKESMISEVPSPNKTASYKVEWKTISQALDRVCFVSALVWHAALIAILFALIDS